MIRRLICINSVAWMGLSAFFLIYPPIRAAFDLRDPAIRQVGIPKPAWRLYRSLTPRYTAWANARVAEGRAENLSTGDISGTEWPLFGSVFYLWAVENLQAAWGAGDHSPGIEPKVFAKDAIVAASELVIDPKHASWVRKHWGDDYLHRQDVFYRMLVMASLTSRANLLHDGAHLDLLRDQTESFIRELDASKSGLLDDYPGQCYPGDVMAALMCVHRADSVLATNHFRFFARALRGFTGRQATRFQLPPYSANAETGAPTSDARGCANSYMCLTAPELWTVAAREWYDIYDKNFWQERFTAAGYREFAPDVPHSNWTIDVDAGPVVAGFGVSANAFGIGAARKNGRFDRAYPLTAELLATVGELPNGVLATPRMLSDASDAPLLGEAAILWLMSVQPERGAPVTTGGRIPHYVYFMITVPLLVGIWRLLQSIWNIHEACGRHPPEVGAPKLQVAVWAALLCGSGVAFWFNHQLIGIAFLLVALMLPAVKRKKAPKGTEGWDNRPKTAPEPAAGAAGNH